MGSWSGKTFGNDAALDWLVDLAESTSNDAIDTVIRQPFDDAAAFMAAAVEGVVMHVTTRQELDEMIAYANARLTSARDRKASEKILRESFPVGESYEDRGEQAPLKCLAAATYVAWRLGRVPAEKSFGDLKKTPAADYVPAAPVVAAVQAGLAAIQTHPAYLKSKPWQAKIAALRAVLAPD